MAKLGNDDLPIGPFPKWTLGLWSKHGLAVSAFGRGIVASCPPPSNGGVFECAANAHLIAAAPALYEAALNLRQHLSLFCGPDDAVANEIFRIADAALSRARGEPAP